jgi:hypothetical protein
VHFSRRRGEPIPRGTLWQSHGSLAGQGAVHAHVSPTGWSSGPYGLAIHLRSSGTVCSATRKVTVGLSLGAVLGMQISNRRANDSFGGLKMVGGRPPHP